MRVKVEPPWRLYSRLLASLHKFRNSNCQSHRKIARHLAAMRKLDKNTHRFKFKTAGFNDFYSPRATARTRKSRQMGPPTSWISYGCAYSIQRAAESNKQPRPDRRDG